MKRKFKLDSWGWIALGIMGLYALFMFYPLINMLYQSVLDPKTSEVTVKNFSKFFSKPYYFSTLVNSLKVTACTTVLTLLVGAPLAYFFTMYKIRGNGVLRILIILSSMSAPFIGAYSWILLLGRNGTITNFLQQAFGIGEFSIYGFSGILLVLTLQLYPLVFLYTCGALKNVDNTLLEASQGMGIRGPRRFATVILPLIMPTLLACGLLVFMRALADFGTPMLIGEGYRTFPVLIYNEFMGEVGGDNGFASAISVIAIIITAIVFLTQKFASNKLAFTMSSMHPVSPSKAKGAFNVFIHLYAYLVVGLSILPQCYVVYTSFQRTEGLIFKEGYWLGSYEAAFSKMGDAIGNTFFLVITSLIIIILLAVLIAYLAVRRRNSLTNIIDLSSMIPYIIPGSVVGIALLTCFNKQPLAISGGFAIMIVALVIRRLPYTIRSSAATLSQIPISVEEASISLGTGKMKTFFTVTLPMMANGIVSGAILSCVTMITELSTSIILYTGRTKTLTVSIYTEVIRGNYGVAAALSTILSLITVTALILFMKISKSKDITM